MSDYLTGSEWDACYYASLGQHACGNFGESMHKTIDALLESGYVFTGLDDTGNKRVQVCNGVNAPKLMTLFFGKQDGVDILDVLDSGRRFLKQYLPALVDETDDEWSEQLQKARAREPNPAGA